MVHKHFFVGNGGYSSGIISFSKNTNVYINVGGRGNDGYMLSSQSSPQTTSNGGYNWGGTGSNVYKSMYCYNCTESTEESTKTISTICTSATPTENCAKQGNGYARITLIK